MHPMVIVSAASDTVFVRTSVDGQASVSLAPGTYVLASAAPIVFEGQEFRWRLSFTVMVGAATQLALSNDNAIRGTVSFSV